MATKSFALPERYKGQEKQSVWLVIVNYYFYY